MESEFQQQHVDIIALFEHKIPGAKFVFQLERGHENNKLHYQGHIKLKTKERVLALAEKLRGTLIGIHLSPDSNIGSTDAEFYATKRDRTYVAGPWADKDRIMPDFSDLLEPTRWSATVRDILLGPSHPRHIYWIWETEGCTGKSNFATYMEINHKVIGLGLGTATDNFYAVSELPARGYIFDIPRTLPKRFDWAEIYMSLEKIKDRNFLSTKYKPKKVILPVIPHLIVFSNYPPARAALSIDRWKVYRIVDQELIEDTTF